tara:strand:- start:270 stop:458 length:189 start_codon:yes stop_codon:yes gene_type:complete
MTKVKLYDPKMVSSFAMMFGINMCSHSKYPEKKKYIYIEKRTKKYGAQRKHDGIMGKYKKRV